MARANRAAVEIQPRCRGERQTNYHHIRRGGLASSHVGHWAIRRTASIMPRRALYDSGLTVPRAEARVDSASWPGTNCCCCWLGCTRLQPAAVVHLQTERS